MPGRRLGLRVADPLDVLDRLALLLPQLARLAALAVGERDHLAPRRRPRPPWRPRRPRARRSRPSARRSPAAAAHRPRPASACSSTAIVRISSSLKPAARNRSAMIARPSSTGGLNDLAEVGRPDRVRSAPTARVAAKHLLPRALAGVRRRERALHQRARAGQLAADRRPLSRCDGNSGCVTTIVSMPASTRRVDDREDLVARRGGRWRARGRGAAIDLEHRARSGSSAPVRVERPAPARGSTPGRAQLELNRTHTGHLAGRVGVLEASRSLTESDRRHPDDPRALARGDLDRERVQPADRVVEHDRRRAPRCPGTAARTTAARSAVEV